MTTESDVIESTKATSAATATTESTSTDTGATIASEATTDTPTEWFKEYGYESKEQFDAAHTEYSTLKSTSAEIAAQKENYDKYLSVLKRVEEAPDPEIATLAAFKKMGIGTTVANQVVGSTAEELEANPLNTLILAEAVANPSKYAKLGKEGVEAALREKYNLGDDSDYIPTAMMKSDAIDAVEKINKIKAEVVEVENPYTFALNKTKEEQQLFATNQQTAVSEIEKVVTGLSEVVDKQGENIFTLKVTKDEIDKILADKEQIAQFFHGKDKAEIQKFVEDRIRIQKYLNGDVFKEWENTRAADVKQETVKTVLNGDAREPNRASSSTTKEVVESPLAKNARENGTHPYVPKQQ